MFALVLDTLLGDTETELRLMSPKERREELLERRAILEREMDLSQRCFEQEQYKYQIVLDSINKQLQTVSTDVG